MSSSRARTVEADGSRVDVRDRVRERAARRFYPEVQALRAVAIGMVLLFHFGSGIRWVGGMYVGVDVFFVISGFLISSHLLSEVDRTGTVRLGAFYARRARRLLPASLSVLAIVVLATPLMLPRETWADTGRAIIAAAFYCFNLLAAWTVAGDPSADLFGLPTIHYWSLSAEEQFYLMWPPLILLAVAFTGRRHRRASTDAPPRIGPVTAVGIALLVVAVLSFVLSLIWTAQARQVSFYMTPTRVWEFAAGGLVALLLRRWAPTQRTASLLRWAGVILILPGSLLLLLPDVMPGPGVLPADLAFPGVMALPSVLGTAFVIVAGAPRPGSIMDRLVEWRPTQWLGLVSYSAYLWHWPLIIAGAVWSSGLDGPARAAMRPALLIASLVLAHIWQRWVEDATRFVPGMKQSTRMSLWAALGGMLLIGAGGLALVLAGS